MTGLQIGQPWDAAGFRDLRLMGYADDAADQAALAAVVQAVRGSAWSVARVAAFYGHPAFDLERDARLVWQGEQPIAAAICYPTIYLHDRPPGNFELFVVPEARGHGLGSRLLAHLEQAARARGHRVLETTIDADDVPGQMFLRAHGFAVVGQSAHLTRPDLADLPDQRLPPGYVLTDLGSLPDAADHYRELANRLGAYDADYRLIEPEVLDTVAARADWEPAGIFVLTDPAGREIGVLRASGVGRAGGYLHEIRLDPAQRGHGLGMALVSAGLAYLAAGGVAQVDLDTDGPDSPPYRLAVRCGFTESHRRQQLLQRPA